MNVYNFLSGIVSGGLGIAFIYAYVIGISDRHEMSFWLLIIGVPLALFGLLLILGSFTKYYCANCGQYLGFEPKTCPRCGSNRYTDRDKGVGDTYRRGSYNL